MSCRHSPYLTDPDNVHHINLIASDYINHEIHPDTEENAAEYINALPDIRTLGEAGLTSFAPGSLVAVASRMDDGEENDETHENTWSGDATDPELEANVIARRESYPLMMVSLLSHSRHNDPVAHVGLSDRCTISENGFTTISIASKDFMPSFPSHSLPSRNLISLHSLCRTTHLDGTRWRQL